MKKCGRCGDEKEATTEFFDYKPANKDGLSGVCIECRKKRRKERYREETKEEENARSRAWYHGNKTKAGSYNKEYLASPQGVYGQFKRYLKNNFKLTPEEYTRMMDEQLGSCAICNTALITCEDKYRPHIDHCHNTGEIRGILCHYCNVGLGMFKDSTTNLTNALIYLNKGE